MSGTSIASVGDHFIVGLRPFPVLHERDRALLGDLRPAGVVLYKSNFRHDLPYDAWLEIHARLIEEIHRAAGRERMFIGIDHEGGRVCRTPPPITRFSYAAHWAQNAAEVGAAMGQELASLGVNLNFAPVLDIHTNPANPVIGERAFGMTAEDVIAAALPFMRSMEAEGVTACGKHFPGHGDTSVDSHLGLPSQSRNLQSLFARELEPFSAAIDAGIGMLMTSHILFPHIDPQVPVTLSRRFTTEILRGRLGFTGVTVSDDIGMGAMNGFFDAPAAAVQFMAAGSDILMVCNHFTDSDRARLFAREIAAALDDGRLPADLLEQSRARIGKLLKRTRANEVRRLSEDVFRTHAAAGVLSEAPTVEVV